MSRLHERMPGAATRWLGTWIGCIALALAGTVGAKDAPVPERADYDIREARPGNGAAAAMPHVDLARAKSLQALRRDGRFPRIALDPLLGTVALVAPREPHRTLAHGDPDERVATLRGYLQQHRDLFGFSAAEIDALEVVADYANPDGRLGWVQLVQRIDGIPVFQGEIRAAFDASGGLVRVLSDAVPALDPVAFAAMPADAEPAVRAAADALGLALPKRPLLRTRLQAGGLVQHFERSILADEIVADAVVFPLAAGEARSAWRVLFWGDVESWYVIVDAHDGELLWKRNLTAFQTQAATYNVYMAENPAPLVPGPTSPDGSQAAPVARVNATLIGNENPNTFNNLGWIADGATTTDGNNAEAGIDRDGVNGVDADGKPVAPGRVFAYSYTPSPGPDEPLGGVGLTAYRSGAVTNAFYWANRFHDATYLLGFTEQARNFQHDNFGRGGVGGDRFSIEVQDSSGTNNANFTTGADGTRGRLQLYVWTGPTPDRDGALDRSVVIHELGHAVSKRLIGNGTGPTGNWGGALGEGWSEFIALTLFATPAEPVSGLYPVGAYSTYLLQPGFTANNYYGIRRFPFAIWSVTGGPSNLPHAPQTFADTVLSQFDISDGAFPPGPVSPPVDGSHSRGEIWALALLEARARLIARHGYAEGNRRMLQYVFDGMKLTPLTPTFLDARDAILAAATASGGGADVGDIWQGFAIRGMGYSASSTTTDVVEAFDLPNLKQEPPFTFSDGQCNSNGAADPGERLQLTVPLSNDGPVDATGTTLSVNGGAPVAYGTVAAGATVTRQVDLLVPDAAACGSSLALTFSVDSSLGLVLIPTNLALGTEAGGTAEDFDDVTAPALPAGWSTVNDGGAVPFWTTTAAGADSAPNAGFVADPALAGTSSLEAPPVLVEAAAARIRFRHRYVTENGYDGGVLEIAVGGGAFQDILAAGASFVTGGYDDVLQTSCGATPNALASRPSWNGDSGGYRTTEVALPESMVGQSVRLRWRFGSDCSVAGTGWWIDDVDVTSAFTCAAASCTTALFQDGFED